jgi:hypothetical protein
MMGPNWADIMEAVGTVGAFVATFFLLLREFGRDRDRDTERQPPDLGGTIVGLDHVGLNAVPK